MFSGRTTLSLSTTRLVDAQAISVYSAQHPSISGAKVNELQVYNKHLQYKTMCESLKNYARNMFYNLKYMHGGIPYHVAVIL